MGQQVKQERKLSAKRSFNLMKLANQTIYNWLATQLQVVGIWRDSVVDSGMDFSDLHNRTEAQNLFSAQELKEQIEHKEQADIELLDRLETHYNWLSDELVRLHRANGSKLNHKLN